MDKDSLPEEKLLKLIRDKKKVPVVSGKESKSSDQKKGPKGKGFFSIVKIFNVLMIFSVLGLVGYLAYQEVLSRESKTKTITRKKVSSGVDSLGDDLKIFEVKPYNFYAQRIHERDLFKRPETPKVEVNAQKESFVRGLRLVGIVLGDNPEVIIEDVQAKRTWFLHQGDEIKSGIIKKIEEGKVVLFYQGQEVEIVQ